MSPSSFEQTRISFIHGQGCSLVMCKYVDTNIFHEIKVLEYLFDKMMIYLKAILVSIKMFNMNV